MVNTTTCMKQHQRWRQENRLHTVGLRAGIWATLQFRWMQLQYPVVALAFERLLLCGSLPVAATALSWGLVAAVGAGQAPFYLAVLLSGVRGLCVQHDMRPGDYSRSWPPPLARGRRLSIWPSCSHAYPCLHTCGLLGPTFSRVPSKDLLWLILGEQWPLALAFWRDAGVCVVKQFNHSHSAVCLGLRRVLHAGLYALLALPLESSFAGGRVLGKGLSPPPAARGGRGPAAETRVQVLLIWHGLC